MKSHFSTSSLFLSFFSIKEKDHPSLSLSLSLSLSYFPLESVALSHVFYRNEKEKKKKKKKKIDDNMPMFQYMCFHR
jgi:hypothetical protein